LLFGVKLTLGANVLNTENHADIAMNFDDGDIGFG
jgi:hypothetical protein